jgi:hypothetical protein
LGVEIEGEILFVVAAMTYLFASGRGIKTASFWKRSMDQIGRDTRGNKQAEKERRKQKTREKR